MEQPQASVPAPEATDDERAQNERKRDILVLIMRFLYEYGYLNSYHALCSETALSLSQVLHS